MKTVANQLKLFSGFIDGIGYAGKMDAQLPDIEFNTEDYDTGTAIIDQLMSLNKMDATITMHGMEPGVDTQLDISTNATKRCVLRGSLDTHDGVQAIKVTMEGVWKKAGGANVQRGAQKLEREYMLNCRVFKYEQAGRTIIDIDVDNHRVIIDGVDQMAAHRANAGL